MRRLYLSPDRFGGDEAWLDGAQARRLTGVLRLRAGAELRVFDGRGAERSATVVEAGRGQVRLAFGAAVEPLPEPPVPVTLVCAFPRGERGDWIVEKTTELGVSRIVPDAAERSVLSAGEGRMERWRRVAVEAAEQCGRAVVPEVGGRPPAGAAELVFDLDAVATVRSAVETLAADRGLERGVTLYVGPEGGWSEAERAGHAEAGRLAVTLGPRTLRVETAAVVGVAQVLEATGALDHPHPSLLRPGSGQAPPSRGRGPEMPGASGGT